MSNQGNYLSDKEQQMLRQKGLLSETEVAMRKGDIIIAVTVLGSNERIIGYSKDVLSESRNILKG